MPVIVVPAPLQAAAGAVNTLIPKPIAGKVLITGVAVRTDTTTKFCTISGCLERKGKTAENIGLYHGTAVCVYGVGAPLWSGRKPWPDNWQLDLWLYTNVVDTKISYCIEYEIVPPKKKGWGQ